MDANERLKATQERIRAAMLAQNIDPATGAPYDDETAPFARFINTLDTSTLPDAPHTVIPDEQVDPALPGSERTVVSINLPAGALDDLKQLSEAARAKLEQAIRDRLTQAGQDAVKQLKAAYVTGRLSRSVPFGITAVNTADLAELQRAINEERIERLRLQHGDEWLNEARELSTTRGIPFEQAVTYLQIRDAINNILPNIEQACNAFAQLAKTFVEHMPESTQTDDNTPRNRRERRARKHTKRMSKGDQSWNRRRNHRNRR